MKGIGFDDEMIGVTSFGFTCSALQAFRHVNAQMHIWVSYSQCT